jgi:hypothetical protein
MDAGNKMMYTNDGLTLLYDTPDAPAPNEDQAGNRDLSFTVLLNPPSPSNAVTVHFRVNGGPIQYFHAVPGQTDYRRNTQCFHVTFPKFGLGQTVDYAVTGSCAGRQVPESRSSGDFPHSFRLVGSDNTSASLSKREIAPHTGGEKVGRFALNGEFLARFTIVLDAPRIVGATPEGIRVTWNVTAGTIEGPRLRAKALQAADWMLIRPDGIGYVDVHGLLETFDGAMIMDSYSGIMDWGENGYRRFLANDLPTTLRGWMTPRFLTADPKYSWLNRVQCVTFGTVFMNDSTYIYDVYVLR